MIELSSEHSLSEIRQRPLIAVCGAASDSPITNYLAEEVGRLLALSGAVVICGGRGGVMAAACRGARAAGGMTIGILPGADRHAANPDVLIALATGMGQARNLLIVQNAAAVIAIGGEYGTLSEIALARKLGRTVIALQSWDLGYDAAGVPHVTVVAEPADAVAQALAAVNKA